MLHVLLQISDRSADLHLIFPFILCPLLLELKFGTFSRLEGVNEINLDLVDVDDKRYVSTRRIEGQITVDGTIIGRADLERTLDCGSLLASESHGNRSFDDLNVTLSEQFNVYILDGLGSAVDKHDLQENVIVVHSHKGLSIDGVGVTGQLVDLFL